MTGPRCEECNESFSPGHKCQPKWLVWNEGAGSDQRTVEIRANSANHAAERWASEVDCWQNYEIVKGKSAFILVRSKDDTFPDWTRWIVSGEYLAHYTAEMSTEENN